MRMRVSLGTLLFVWASCGPLHAFQLKKPTGCVRAVLNGEVEAGKPYAKVFAPGLEFLLEPIASGWIVRVLPMGQQRGAHNYAELATPPYEAVTPLAIGTDFSFRAQDAVGWNPRHFRYVATQSDFARMVSLYEPAMHGDGNAVAALSALAAQQPEAELRIAEAHLVPGANDQAQMAAAVASHFATTPHTIDQSSAKSPLGRVTWMKFTATFDLPQGVSSAPGVVTQPANCPAHPTTTSGMASDATSSARKK